MPTEGCSLRFVAFIPSGGGPYTPSVWCCCASAGPYLSFSTAVPSGTGLGPKRDCTLSPALMVICVFGVCT